MSRLILVRHGKAALGWGEDPDPGLDDTGREQAEAMAAVLAPSGPKPLVVSPLRRTRETAAPLEARWGMTARVEPGVGEIESPTAALDARSAWLKQVMAKRWSDLDAGLRAWRQRVLDTVAAFDDGTVVVTHFVAINVVAGAATGDDRVVCVMPAYCSRTTVDVEGGRFSMVDLGGQAVTQVL